jgi:adenylate cyclase
MALSRKQKRRLLSIPIGIGIGIVFCLLYLLGVFEALELKSLDLRYGIRGERPLSDRVSLVAVDEETINKLGWPVPRVAYANLLNIADKNGARAIGFDVLFSDPSVRGEKEDAIFAEVARLTGKTVFPVAMTMAQEAGSQGIPAGYLESGLKQELEGIEPAEASGAIPPIAGLAGSSAGMCHYQLDNREDGVFRKVPLFIRYGELAYPAMSLRLVLNHLGEDLESLSAKDGDLVFGRSVTRVIPLSGDRQASAYINYKTVSEGIRVATLIEVIRSSRGQDAGVDLKEFFDGKIVLVGQTAGNIGDHGPTPFSNMSPLVLAHANFIDNLMTGDFLVRAGRWANLLLILLLCVAVALCAGYLRIAPGAGAAAAILLAYAAAAQLWFSRSGYWIGLAAPFTAGIFVYLGVSVYNRFVRDADERLYRQTFERFVAPGMLERIVENPDTIDMLGSTKRLSILFSDIKGYTAMSQEVPVSEVLALLREYMGVMTRVLFTHGGTIDKIMGDGIMAFFGDPIPQSDHAHRAVLAAHQMQEELKKLQRKWISEGKAGLQIRIGIATGDVYVGNIGSRHHIEYTALGRAVNLAARLESKAPPGGILVSQETYEEVKDAFDCEEIPGLELKGYRESYKAYWVFGLTPAEREAAPAEVPPPRPERRESTRIELVTGIRYSFGEDEHTGRVVNASRNGMFIAAETLPVVGAKVALQGSVHADEELLPLEIYGEVMRVETDGGERGMGIRFDRIIADNPETIRYCLRNVFGLQNLEDDIIASDTADRDTPLFRYDFDRMPDDTES